MKKLRKSLRDASRSGSKVVSPVLQSRRLTLRPLVVEDFAQWTEVRQRCRDWLLPWEPRRQPSLGDPDVDFRAFQTRCQYMFGERKKGRGFGFGIFLGDQLIGEMNMSSVYQHPFYSCFVGYWIDQQHAGQSYTPEALAAVLRFAFEECNLFRVQIAIVPTNEASLKVMEKLKINQEGIARKFLEINGAWEDHACFAMTVEDWAERSTDIIHDWLS